MENCNFDTTLEIKNIDETGSFTGYASIFDVVDSHNDVVAQGAFKNIKKYEKGDVKLLWQHRPDEPIGVIENIKEDGKGLHIEGKLLLEVRQGKEAYTLLKSGAMKGLSIGYNVNDYDIDRKTNIRNLKSVDLWEISLVTFPANGHASITSIKSQLPKTEREFETFLRDAGFSRKHSKEITSGGFIVESVLRDADETKAITEKIDSLINNLKGK